MMNGIDSLSVAICAIGFSGLLAAGAIVVEVARKLNQEQMRMERIKQSVEGRR